MVGRPSVSSIVLKYHGRTLNDDDEIVNDLLEELDSDDEEEDSDVEDTIGEEDDEDIIKLTLTADIVPPIDTKFGIELREQINKMSTKDILEAYCINMAGMIYESELHLKECELYDRLESSGESGELEDGDEVTSTSTATENSVTAVPFGRYFCSASRPSRPVNVHTLRLIFLSLLCDVRRL